MKKLTALLLALIMVLSLAACGGDKADETPKQEETKKEETKQEETKQEETKTEEPAAEPGAKPDGFPSKNLTMIVPVAAGSAVDVVSRVFADSVDLGGNIVVENLAGASQTIGTAECLNRDHDGHTFSSVAMAGLLTQPLINPGLGYDKSDFRVVGEFAISSQSTICVPANSELQTVEDLMELINSGESYNYGVANVGGISQLSSAEMMLKLGETDGTEIVYNGSAELTAAMLSGEIAFGVQDDDYAYNYVKNGEWRMLMSLTANENPYYPGSPYVGQYVDGFVDMPGFKALIMPADTPEDIFNFVRAEMEKTVQSDEYQDKMVELGKARMTFRSGDEFEAFLDEVMVAAKEIMLSIGLIEE